MPHLGHIMGTPVSGCEVDLTATRVANAMVNLVARSPCTPDRDILVQDAEFTILVDNIDYGHVCIAVPAVRRYHRAIVHWCGNNDLQLHVFEVGIGDPGHIWSASVPDMTGQRDFVQRFGLKQVEHPHLTEIYTYPVGFVPSPVLQLGVTVTPDNCGRAVHAWAFQISAESEPAGNQLSVLMPGCDEIGNTVIRDGNFGPVLHARR